MIPMIEEIRVHKVPTYVNPLSIYLSIEIPC